MAETITLEVAMGKLSELARTAPMLRKFAGDTIVAAAIRRGVAEIVGGTLKASGVNRDHARYFATSLTRNVADDGAQITTGLPKNEEEARILAWRETGGTVRPKADRPNSHLRIPLPAALLPSGYERADNTGKVFRNHQPYSNSPFQLKTRKQLEAEGASVPPFGGAFLVNRATGQPWYVLARSATQRPHPWWTKAGVKVREEMDALLTAALTRWEVSRAKGGPA